MCPVVSGLVSFLSLVPGSMVRAHVRLVLDGEYISSQRELAEFQCRCC